MKLLISSFFLLLLSCTLSAQDLNVKSGAPSATSTAAMPDPLPFGNMITAGEIKTLITMLASDSFQGRETGEPGQRLAATYIAAQMKAAGLPAVGDHNNYLQDVRLEKTNWKDIGILAEGQVFKNREDFFVYPAFIRSEPVTAVKDVVFVGYGVDDPAYNDYKDASVEGKVVVFYDGEPMDNKGMSLITKNAFRSKWALSWRKKVELAQKKGATMVFIIDPMLKETVKNNRKLINTFGWTPVDSQAAEKMTNGINTVFISEALAKAIFDNKWEKVQKEMTALRSGASFSPVKAKTKTEVRLDKDAEVLEGSNVIGFIEGSDSLLKNEYVFVTAHYDHLGHVDERVYYGADDNASGTSGVIEIARAFAEAKKKGVGPKRSVVCMLVSGEEKGLLGSKYYVEFPLYSLKNTVADINIDMIGRVDTAHRDGNYIYVIGSDRLSTELHDIQEHANYMYTHLKLDYTYNDPRDPNHYYERSDHYNFAERGIPSVFYFNGTHPDYHKATDTVDKINFEAAAKRAQLAFYTAWEIANRPKKLFVDKKK